MDALVSRADVERPDVLVRISDVALSAPGQVDRPILENVSLDIRTGEFLAIVGPSGIGKSTLLRAISGLVAPSRGTISAVGRPRASGKFAALVFQDARLLPWRRVRGNVEFGLEGIVPSRSVRRDRARNALRLVGLEALENRWPHQLSGGQQQRVSIARALALEPELLLMDEPFSALDIATRRTLQDEISGIWRTAGATVVLVTHDLDEAIHLADRVVVLGGSPATIKDIVEVPIARPRSRPKPVASEPYAALKGRLAQHFNSAAPSGAPQGTDNEPAPIGN
ncbi:ABC transporter ATP-binding protein [Hyphomicrobium sp. LHD-15]|uniref:ABC transporter ATP-binding protein n=1 Tax=Hyphomicrobium sp. LHD-15 TaxID=3072142 RepID=UPI0035BE64A0